MKERLISQIKILEEVQDKAKEVQNLELVGELSKTILLYLHLLKEFY